MPLASPIAEPFFELKSVFTRRAWGMTAKVAALWIAVSLAWPMRFVAGEKAPRDSGQPELEKNGAAASGSR